MYSRGEGSFEEAPHNKQHRAFLSVKLTLKDWPVEEATEGAALARGNAAKGPDCSAPAVSESESDDELEEDAILTHTPPSDGRENTAWASAAVQHAQSAQQTKHFQKQQTVSHQGNYKKSVFAKKNYRSVRRIVKTIKTNRYN